MKNMEDKLRNRFAQSNLESMESDPLEGHLDRFETKLLRGGQEKKTRIINLRMMMAAVVAACFIGFVIFWVVKSSNELEEIQLAVNEPMDISDYSEAAGKQKEFFEELIETKKAELDFDDPDTKELIEALHKLEQEHEVLQNKLNQNFHNEHLINAVIDNYKLRLEILEKIQKIIQFKNKVKNQSDEKVYS